MASEILDHPAVRARQAVEPAPAEPAPPVLEGEVQTAAEPDLPSPVRAHGISVREYEVLTLVAARLTSQEIGRQLFLSPRTVEKHVASLFAKSGAGDRAALISFAARISGSRKSG